jgi:hypothetical protein
VNALTMAFSRLGRSWNIPRGEAEEYLPDNIA